MNFIPSKTPTGLLYHANKISKIRDFTNYKNALFVQNKLRKGNPTLFNEMFNMLNQNHTYNSRAATYNLLHIPQVWTSHFGEVFIRFKASETWNDLQGNLNMDLLSSVISDFKKSTF